MSGCILGCQYIPSVEYFAHWAYHGEIQLEANEHYQKRTWRNRTCIESPEEPLSLTVPLRKGKHQQLNIKDVLIAFDDPWTHRHLVSLQSAYGKTAFGEEVLEGIAKILNSKPSTLWQLNLEILHYIISFLPGQWLIKETLQFEKEVVNNCLDLRQGVPAVASSLAPNLIPTYPQLHRLNKSFQANLSILDALCHLGPGTHDYLTRYASQLYPLHESDR